MTTPKSSPIVTRALGYPYPRPSESFMFANGRQKRLPDNYKPKAGDVAVLAIGSNAAPTQLLRKFGAEAEPIAVLAAQIHGVDVVYCNLGSGYGSVPATLVPSLGCTVRVHVTMLNRSQLEQMNRSETGYYLCKVRKGRGVSVEWVDVDLGIDSFEFYCYIAQGGVLLVDGQVRAITEMKAKNRVFASMTQAEIQERVKEDVTGVEGESLETFIEKNVVEKGRIARMRESMQSRKVCISKDGVLYDAFDLIEKLG